MKKETTIKTDSAKLQGLEIVQLLQSILNEGIGIQDILVC